MPSFQPVPKGIRVQLEVAGQRASKTLPTKREAQQWARDKDAELRASAKGNHGHGKTLQDAIKKFMEEESPKRRGEDKELIRLKAFQGLEHGLPLSKPIALLDDQDLRAWRDRRLAKNKRSSVLRDMTLMSAVLEAARTEWKWISANPLREVKKPSKPAHRKRIIGGLEVRNVLRALGYARGPARTVSQSVAVCFLLALATGMRAGELCSLRWEDVREVYGTAHNVKAREVGVSRDVPFSAVARRLLERMRGWDEETVFGLSAATLDALFRRARKRAGYDDFTFHDSRHTAATRLALSGKWNVLELCKAFGWKSTSQALTYFNPTAGDLAAKL